VSAQTQAGTDGLDFRDPGEDEPFYNYLGFKEYLEDTPYPAAVCTNAYDGERLVGSVVYGREQGATWIYHVYVDPDYRGRGLFRLFYAEAADLGKPVRGDWTIPWLPGLLDRYNAA